MTLCTHYQAENLISRNHRRFPREVVKRIPSIQRESLTTPQIASIKNPKRIFRHHEGIVMFLQKQR